MKKAKFYILLSLFLNILYTAEAEEEYRYGAVPSWVENIPVPSYEPGDEEISNGEYYLLSDIQVNRDNGEYYNHFALKLTNSTGLENNSQVSIDFDPAYESLVIHHIHIIRDGRVSDRTENAITSVIQQEKELEKLLYNGMKSYYAILSDIRIGDILEVAYTISEKDRLFSGINDQYYLEWAVPVHRIYRRILNDGTAPLVYRSNKELPEPEIREDREYIWDLTKSDTVDYEDNVPYWFDAHNYLEVSQYSDWDEVRSEILAYYDPLTLEKEQADYILSQYPLLKETEDPEEITEILLNAVQEDVRYMGIEIGRGSYIPTAPYDVYTRRFGDCKDKSLLLSRLLREKGIEAYPVLVHNSSGKELATVLPGPYQFNHVIVKVMIDEQSYWLDPTYTYQEGELDKISTPLYSYGLVLSDKSRGLEAITPGFDGTNLRISETFTLPSEVTEPGEYRIVTEYYDEDADYMRSWLANATTEEISEELVDYMGDYYSDLEIAGEIDFKDDVEANRLTLTESYRIPQIWEYFSEDDKYQFTYSPYEIYNYTYEPESKDRTMPYYLRHPYRLEQTVTIQLPEEWNISDSEERIETSHFQYDHRISYREREVKLSYVYQSKADSVSPEQLFEYGEEMKKIGNEIDYIIFWNPEAESVRMGSDGLSPIVFPVIAVSLLLYGMLRRRKRTLDQIH